MVDSRWQAGLRTPRGTTVCTGTAGRIRPRQGDPTRCVVGRRWPTCRCRDSAQWRTNRVLHEDERSMSAVRLTAVRASQVGHTESVTSAWGGWRSVSKHRASILGTRGELCTTVRTRRTARDARAVALDLGGVGLMQLASTMAPSHEPLTTVRPLDTRSSERDGACGGLPARSCVVSAIDGGVRHGRTWLCRTSAADCRSSDVASYAWVARVESMGLDRAFAFGGHVGGHMWRGNRASPGRTRGPQFERFSVPAQAVTTIASV